MKDYKVKFIGTCNIEVIPANNEKEAKAKFASANNVQVSTYIVIVRK